MFNITPIWVGIDNLTQKLYITNYTNNKEIKKEIVQRR